MEFKVGQRVVITDRFDNKQYGEITIIKDKTAKVLFDDSDMPYMHYYSFDQLELESEAK